MSFVGDVIGDVVGGITGAKQQAKAAGQAAQTQAGMAEAGIEEQRRQFDAIVKMMAPFVGAGAGALGGYAPYQQAGQQALGGLQGLAGITPTAINAQMALSGLAGPEAQRQAIAQIQGGPEMQAYLQQGQNAILQNASATGGLRGGNTQAAMAQLAPNILSNLIGQKYNQFAGLSNLGAQTMQNLASSGQAMTSDLARMGQASAGLQAGAGQSMAANVGNLLGQQGAALAGGQMAAGSVPSSAFGTVLQGAGLYAGLGGSMPSLSGLTGGLYSGGRTSEYFPSNTHVTSRAAW